MTEITPRTPSEQQRLEALLRLDVVRTGAEPELDDAVRLIAELMGAHAVALTLVTADRAWTKAATIGQFEVDRRGSLAELAVDSPAGLAVIVVAEGSAFTSHPAVRGLDLPVTCGAVVVRGPTGEPVGALEVVWDARREVNEQAAARMLRAAAHLGHLLELRAEAREYRRFIELNPDPVLVLDIDAAIVLANPSLVTLLGYETADDLVGTPFVELVDRQDRTRVTAELGRVMFARSRTAQIELVLHRRDGDVLTCAVSAGNLQGARRHLQLVVHDLSDRLRSEEQRSRLSEQLARAQRMDAVGQIAGGLAHDLNNLLVVMVSNLSLAEESLTDAERSVGHDPLAPVCQDLAELRLSVDRAGALTSSLLEFAQRRDGTDEVASVVEVVATVRGLIERSLGRDVTLEVVADDRLPPVAADPGKLERALVNLVINARDAMPDGGTVRLTAVTSGEVVEDRRQRTGRSRAAVTIEVSDDGCGMDAYVQARAFEPLFTTKGEGGTGFGLATVAAFVDEIDGSIQLESRPGEGTRVRLHLPVAEAVAEPMAVGLDVPVGGARVMVVEPGERTRRVIVQMLQGAGYRVQAHGSAEEVLPLIAGVRPDLLITELSLPGMPGARLLTEVREHHPELRTVALTALDAPGTVDGTPVLVKPFSHTRLLRTVKRVLRKT